MTRLNALNPKIKAMCHPPWSPFLWSHHQKFVVVDDVVGFVGGVDLCFGRWEDNEYSVVDVGGGGEGEGRGEKFPGRDYLNFNVPGATETNGGWEEEVLDRKIYPRTPWFVFWILLLFFILLLSFSFSFSSPSSFFPPKKKSQNTKYKKA